MNENDYTMQALLDTLALLPIANWELAEFWEDWIIDGANEAIAKGYVQ